jgi:transposase-like protein
VEADIRGKQTVKADGFQAYDIISKSGHKHQPELVKEKKAHEVMTCTHILISNAKAFILRTFHGVGKKYLKAYLDEFCFPLNGRTWEPQLFDRLVSAFVNSQGACYAELTE